MNQEKLNFDCTLDLRTVLTYKSSLLIRLCSNTEEINGLERILMEIDFMGEEELILREKETREKKKKTKKNKYFFFNFTSTNETLTR